MSLSQIAQAFEHFDLAMDPLLDLEQDRSMQAAISTGLAIRLVAYATGAKDETAEGIALSLVRELTTMKRQIRHGEH